MYIFSVYSETAMNRDTSDTPQQTRSVRDPIVNGRVDLMTSIGREVLPQLNDHRQSTTSYTEALTGDWESSVCFVVTPAGNRKNTLGFDRDKDPLASVTTHHCLHGLDIFSGVR